MMTKRLYRSRTTRMLAGVCGGLAEYFEIDVTLVRLIFIIATAMSSGLMIAAYIVLWLIEPEEP